MAVFVSAKPGAKILLSKLNKKRDDDEIYKILRLNDLISIFLIPKKRFFVVSIS